ncbi:CheY-like chemotaxis protein [Streptosporangium album]|uniref:histidine kinase n=1 Tax=Streptosporangium album TaxID=47479 RepID=A0A7W7RYX1_9ACTN|nr:histidine kinase dimerization/phospho-acceptor domain-containing protein [Streptosporangium album]MBB4940803.1 CheY-like chemotaxis protein [Streptosporangium album]
MSFAGLGNISEAKDRFWATVSHELRTPLNSIIGLIRLLVGPGGDPLAEEQHHQIQLIGSSAETLLSLVSELLDMAKAEAGRLDPQPSVVDLVALAERLRMTLRLTVADTGIGVPEEHLERVFEEFFQVPGPIQARAKGTGLGLPYALRLAQAPGGTLQLTSADRAGTTVTLRLPHRDDEAPVVGRVLVADDDEDFRATVRRMFTGFAVHVDEAPDGLVALQMMAENPPDLALVDLLMPRLDGAALIQRMAEDERLREIPVVVVTVATSSHYPQGAGTVVSKHGLRRESLLEAVRNVLGHNDE